MSRRKITQRNKLGGSILERIGPFFLAFVAGGLTLWLLLLGSGKLRTTEAAGTDPVARGAVRVAKTSALAELLLPQADWIRRDSGLPMHWFGEVPSSESLVQWHARLSAAIRGMGLEILEGEEEITPQPRAWPSQRLTLAIGDGGELLATIVIETTRSPALPEVF